MQQNYRQWLEAQKYGPGTITAQMHRAGRVEECYGDLDEHFNKDRLQSVISELTYSTDDERRNRPNPSTIPFQGNIRNNLASYRDATKRYRRFRDEGFSLEEPAALQTSETMSTETAEEVLGRRMGLERDMQAALRAQIDQLESGLKIIDEGAERSVDSGFIDITARDADGSIVVIELKAGMARQAAVAQILSYMGDIVTEEPEGKIRGILVASEFDSKAKAAARMVPMLTLRKYSIQFLFADGHQ